MKKTMILILAGIVLASGCLCCNMLDNKESCPGGQTLINEVCCADSDKNGICDETETTTTLGWTLGTLPQQDVTTTIVEAASTASTETTVPTTLPIANCVKSYQVTAGEVVFVYTFSCCQSLDTTVGQLGTQRFTKIELSHMSSRDKSILKCFGIEDTTDIRLAQFLCPASNDRMIIGKEEFKGAKERIRDFAMKCKQDADQNA